MFESRSTAGVNAMGICCRLWSGFLFNGPIDSRPKWKRRMGPWDSLVLTRSISLSECGSYGKLWPRNILMSINFLPGHVE